MANYKQIRVYYLLDDGSRRTQTLPATDDATDDQAANVVKKIANITTRTVETGYLVDHHELNLEEG